MNDTTTALVHTGWDHLKSQRPLAAWASWQRALRIDPESKVALSALAKLESATELPLAARVPYRFREPRDPVRRATWNERIAGENLEDLDAAAGLFERLAALDVFDAAAWYNRALCLAWAGKNADAIECLARVVDLEATAAFEDAVTAWMLAEVLRQGGGAETLADDLRFAFTIGWDPGDTQTLLREFPEIRKVPTPRAPSAAGDEAPEVAVFEWLDRAIDPTDSTESESKRVVTVLASVFITASTLRLSSLRALNLERIEEQLFPRLEYGPPSVRREAAPLPLAFQDADLWTFRMPPEIDPSAGDELAREAIERYFENDWIHRKRKGLADRSPLEASAEAGRGDSVARVKLEAIVRMREQLGRRVSTQALYKGYPFDRLRRRLGLEPSDAGALDPSDLSCAPGAELDRLELGSLNDVALLDAATSAAGLLDDARTARFAAEVLHRPGKKAPTADWQGLIAALVREAIKRDDPLAALDWIERAREIAEPATAVIFQVWRAEILARQGRGEAALEVYRELIEREDASATMALDAALFMIDNGEIEPAIELLTAARELARRSGMSWLERRAARLLEHPEAGL